MRILFGLLISLLCLAAPCFADGPTDDDPLEGFNRPMFSFNDTVDVYVLEPVAKGWDKVVPNRVQTSISSFFENLRSPYDCVHGLLQARPHQAAVSFARFIGNTTFGLAGFFDPMSDWGLQSSSEDFGQTFAVWGIPSGPYLVLPFMGPSTIRDTAGFTADSISTVHGWFIPAIYPIFSTATRTVNDRARALKTVRNIKEASVDYYTAVRNGYLQRRQAQIQNRRGAATSADDDLYKIDEE